MRPLVLCSLLLCFALSANCNALTSQDTEFYCFTQDNPTTSEIIYLDAASIMLSQIEMTKDTVITVHNFGESVISNFNSFIVPSTLSVRDVNVLAVDWSKGCRSYTEGLRNAPYAGRLIAQFINVLHTSFNYNGNIQIIGHGLGGHAAGIAARSSLRAIDRITALDPSLHGWTHHTEKLTSSDAAFVEVLHATAGFKGYDRPLGDIDFYPNGGSAQPGCFSDVDCSSAMSYVYYSESITSEMTGGPKFEAISCDSHEQASVSQCEGPYTATFGGTAPNNSPPGVYHFSTNAAPPFAQTPRTEESDEETA